VEHFAWNILSSAIFLEGETLDLPKIEVLLDTEIPRGEERWQTLNT